MSFRIIELFNTADYLTIIFLILITYLFRFYYNYHTRPNPLPGPLPLLFGLENVFFDGNFKDLAADLYKKYGDICEFRLGGSRRIVLTKTDYFENLLSNSKNLALFTKHDYSPDMNLLKNYGRGMFLNNDYDTWKVNKYFLLQSISTPGFNNDSIKYIIELFEELDGYWNLLKKFKSSNDDNNDDRLEIDFLSWANRFMTDNISIIITGERGCSMASYYNTFNSDKSDKSELASSSFDDSKPYNSDKFTQALVTYMRGAVIFHVVHPLLRRYVPFFRIKVNKILESRDYLLNTMDDMIERRKLDFKNTPQKLKSKHDLLTNLITANYNAKSNMTESLSDEDIRALIFDVFLAGSDTSSNMLCFMIYYICHNTHVKQKLFDEIDSVFPNNSDTLSITFEHLEKLKYCESIVKETFRMMPVLPVSQRVASAECEVAGYTWPAKTTFHLNFASIHMNEKYWDNPTIFDPDRFYLKNDLSELNDDDLNNFDNENRKFIQGRDKYSLVMFGGGIRICPGRKLAMINILSFMTLMFKKYDVELMNKEAPLKTQNG
ncbi:12896_t:CDS:2, partial [Cetraspora pellucida]